jgi:FG-GAP repeat
LIGEPFDRGQPGAVYVFIRRHRVWTQQGPKLVADCTSSCGGPNGTGEVSDNGDFGMSVALSADGNTALIGAGEDNDEEGAVWVFRRHDGLWNQQGPKLVGDCTRACGGPNGTGEAHAGDFGDTVALSGDGRTALIGGPGARSA